jgi:hypothetical protein
MSDHERRIQVLAVGFPELALAQAAEVDLRHTLDLAEGDLSLDEVGGDEEFVDGAVVVLAGRIREFRLEVVERIVKRHRGVVLTSVPERWARSQPGAGDRTAT